MATGTRLRKEGQRKDPKYRSSLLSNSLGVQTSDLGEKRLNLSQVYALETMFHSHPAVQAARTVLSGQLLSGGISLRKEGKDVELTPQFKDHLNEVWIPFAQDVIDSFLKWGLVPISYEEYEDDTRRAALLAKRRKVAESANLKGKGGSKAAKAAATAAAESTHPLIIPIVPILGSYEVAYTMGGRQGYKREYLLYSNAPGKGTCDDEEARVIVRQHPDSVGNVNSPLASVFDLGSFVSALTELALTAESSRSRPRIVTQTRKKDASALDPGNLFFDSESRAVQSGADQEENASQARSLQFQHALCSIINKLQTTTPSLEHNTGSFSGSGALSGKQRYAPPEVQPSLFTLPKDHELAPNLASPESRGDLEGLFRLAIEQFSASLGVPSDLIFTGRFAGKSTSQLSLLNITVSQLAKSVNSVLTIAYRDIYSEGPSDELGQLQLLTSPLSATEEVLNLYAGGLVPVEIAMPAVLNAIGTTKEDIDAAVEKAVAERDKTNAAEDDDKEFFKKDREVSLEDRKAALEGRKKENARIGKDTVGGTGGSDSGKSGEKGQVKEVKVD